MEKEKASKVSEMRLKFEDGCKTTPQSVRQDNNRGNDVSELAGLAAVARRRDKPQISVGMIVNSNPFKSQLGRRRSSDSIEARSSLKDVHQLKQELKVSPCTDTTANRHTVARRTVSEFVLRNNESGGKPEDEKPVTPVPVPRRRNPKKLSLSPKNTSASPGHFNQGKDASPALQGNGQNVAGSRLSRSWLHESSNCVTTPTPDKIKRPLPELPSSPSLTTRSSPSLTTRLIPPVSDKPSPNANASAVPCNFKPKVPCVGGSLVQQIVLGINSGASPKSNARVNGAKMENSANSSLSSSPPVANTNGEVGNIAATESSAKSARFKSPSVQDAIRNLDSNSAEIKKPLPKGPPPHKPPRTFEHDMYLAQRGLIAESAKSDADRADLGKKCVTFRDSAANHVYDEVLDVQVDSSVAKEGSTAWFSEAGDFQRSRSFTTPGERGARYPRGNGRTAVKTPPPPPPPIFKRNNDNDSAKKTPVTKTPTTPYAVSKLQHRLIAKFSHGGKTPEVPARKSKFFVDLKKKTSPEGRPLPMKRSLSSEHIYDEPYAEPELTGRQLLRSMSDEAISNPEYDGLSCSSGMVWPPPNIFPEKSRVGFNGSEHSRQESGLHYLSTPILRKGRSYSYDACMPAGTTKPSDKIYSRGWIKANCETPKTPNSRPTNPVSRTKFN